MSKDLKVLFYDIETSPLLAWIWSLGKQVVRHTQLHDDYNCWGVICISYQWLGDNTVHTIDWGYNAQNTRKVVEAFDKIVEEADIIIGKNSDRFDNKMINTMRLFHGLPGNTWWLLNTDDLEKQMRKYFRLPSNTLDYLSAKFGLGGKIRMEMIDWIDIVLKSKNGKSKFKKMLKYSKKDVKDLSKLWKICSGHFVPKFKYGVYNSLYGDGELRCRYVDCKSRKIKKNGTHVLATGKVVQRYMCTSCNRVAGSVLLGKDKRGLQ